MLAVKDEKENVAPPFFHHKILMKTCSWHMKLQVPVVQWPDVLHQKASYLPAALF